MKEQIKKTLQELEKIRENDNPRWNISRETGIFINNLIKACQAKKVLEVGTSNGYSGIWIAEALQEHQGELTTVESHEGRFKEAQNNFSKAKLSPYIKQIKGHAPEALDDSNDTFDLMFFDATKSEHLSYFEKLHQKLKPKGLLLTDNVISHQEKMQKFLDAISTHEDYQSVTIPIGAGILMALKLR